MLYWTGDTVKLTFLTKKEKSSSACIYAMSVIWKGNENSTLAVCFFVFSPGMTLPVGLVYIIKQWGEAAWWLVQRDNDELGCCNMTFLAEYKVGSMQMNI